MPEIITINGKNYKVSDLSEEAIGLANNIQVIQNGITQKQTEIGIYQLASDTLIAQLVSATSDLTPVETPTAE